MSQANQVYGGDEVNAVVLDPGSYYTRVGWSAEDVPSILTPTDYSVDESPIFGDEANNYFKPGRQINNCMTDSIVSDWEAAPQLWKYAISQQSGDRTAEHLKSVPLMITEPHWNTKANQVKTIEFGLYECEAPAMYIAKSATLSLFSAGRGTGLVVDVGHSTASVVPIVDGMCLLKSARKSRKAGKFVNNQIAQFLGTDVTPQFEVKSKAPLVKKELSNVTSSFREYHVAKVYENFKESMVQVAENSFDPAKEYPNRTFEFPDGHTIDAASKRFEIGEDLFKSESKPDSSEDKMDVDEDKASNEESANPAELEQHAEFSELGIGEMIVNSINSCDIDVRPHLANNIVVTGGTTLVQGFTDRVHSIVAQSLPMLKIRIFASGNTQERVNAAWIGGSILSSLGTFHQLWVTKQEYEEVGADQLIQKRFR